MLCERNSEELKPSEASIHFGVLCNGFVQLLVMREILRRETNLEKAFKAPAFAVVVHNAYKDNILVTSYTIEVSRDSYCVGLRADMETVRKLKISASVGTLTLTSRSSSLNPSH